jgi:drug/metabolite transporter (DMT)-like permease
LIKKALIGLEPVQVGAIRTGISGIMLIAIGYKSILSLPKNKLAWIALSGFLGSFFPAFLFAYAQTEIDSAISAILNSTVPLLTLTLGSIIFGIAFIRNQFIGIVIGLIGAVALILTSMSSNPDQNYLYAGLVLVACICYASNANIIKSQLQEIKPLGIAAGNYVFILLPSIGLFFVFDGAEIDYTRDTIQNSLIYISILCLFGTVAAKVMFNKLVQITSPVFASSVTYLMPVIGLGWGVLDGEEFGVYQLTSTMVIIFAVILVTQSRVKKRRQVKN